MKKIGIGRIVGWSSCKRGGVWGEWAKFERGGGV